MKFYQIEEELVGKQNFDFVSNEYIFFDLIKANRENFIRLTEIKIYYDMETILIEKKAYQKMFGNLPQDYSQIDSSQK